MPSSNSDNAVHNKYTYKRTNTQPTKRNTTNLISSTYYAKKEMFENNKVAPYLAADSPPRPLPYPSYYFFPQSDTVW